MTMSQTTWHTQARCATKIAEGVDFFPDPNDAWGNAVAKVVCMHCPVRTKCLEENWTEHYGVWGGTTEIERARLVARKTARRLSLVPGRA